MNNRFAALINEGVNHGGCPAITDLCATNWHVIIKNDKEAESLKSNIMAKGTMMDEDDDRSIGTTQSANTIRRSKCSYIMPTKRSMMMRGAAWNVIRERN